MRDVYTPRVAIVLGELKRLASLGALQQLRESLDIGNRRTLLLGCLGDRQLFPS